MDYLKERLMAMCCYNITTIYPSISIILNYWPSNSQQIKLPRYSDRFSIKIPLISKIFFPMPQDEPACDRPLSGNPSAHTIKTNGTRRVVICSDQLESHAPECDNRSEYASGYSFSRFEGMSEYQVSQESSSQLPGSQNYIPTSNKVITSSHLISPPLEVRALPTEQCTMPEGGSEASISFLFECVPGAQQVLLDNFANFGQKSDMQILSVEARKVTIKNEPTFLKKIFKICLPQREEVHEVYQLRTAGRSGNKMRLVLVAGEQRLFEEFWKKYSQWLWSQNFLKCSTVDDIRHFQTDNEIQIKNIIKILKESRGSPEGVKKMLACQKELLKKYGERTANMEDISLSPVVERLFVNQFYELLQVRVWIGENSLGAKAIGDLERKKMIIKGSLSQLDILGYLELKEDLTPLIQKLQKHQKGKSIFPKSIEMLDSIVSNNYPCPHQWSTLLVTFEKTLKDETKSYNSGQVKDKTFDPKLTHKLLILALVLCSNRQIWGIIRTCTMLADQSETYQSAGDTERLEKAMKFLEEDWEI